MKDCRNDYICIIYALTMLDNDDIWEEILVNNNFNYKKSKEILIKKLNLKIKENNEQCRYYKEMLIQAMEMEF